MQRVAFHQFAHLRLAVAMFLVLFGLLAVSSAVAQEVASIPTPVTDATTDADPGVGHSIPSGSRRRRCPQGRGELCPDARLQQIQQELPDEQARIEELRKTTEKELETPGPASIIKESEKSWVRAQARLDRWLLDLSARSGALDGTLDDLEEQHFVVAAHPRP